MPVNVRNLNTGGAGAVTDVTDTFNRGTLNPTGQLLWMMVPLIITPITNPIGFGNPFCSNPNLILGGLANGNTGTYFPTLLPCVGLSFKKCNGFAQHSQCTFQSILNANGFAGGPAVMLSWNGQASATWYGLNFSQGGTPFLERCSVASNVLTTTTLFTASPGQNANDVWRLSFDPSTNIPTVTKNGTVVYNTVDGSPLSGGIPGFQIRTNNSVAGNANQVVISAADCGLGI